ncbi:MAG: 50S ribosomal protein L24 [Nitrospirota bacterium]
MGLTVKKNDTVVVTAGKEKSKRGRVLSVFPAKEQVLVEKINVVKKHMKPSRKYTQGGIVEREAPLHVSNVMIVCPKCNKPTRIGNTILQTGKKVRMCKKCREVMD